MKKTISAIFAVIIAATLAVSAFAADYVLDFSVCPEGGYTFADGVYTLAPTADATRNTKALVSKIDADGVEFQFKANGGWDMFTIVAKDKYNESGLNGVGMKFRYDNGVEVTYMPVGNDWQKAADAHIQIRVLHDLPDGQGVLNNNEWHTVKISIVDGYFSVLIDGHETVMTQKAGIGFGYSDDEMKSILDLVGNGGEAIIGFGYNSYDDIVSIKPAEVKVAPQTADFTAIAVVVAAVAAAVVFAKKH